MRSNILVFFTLICFATFRTESDGSEIGFQFSGAVFQSLAAPFGNHIPAFSPVSGRIVYNTNSEATHTFDDCDCAGYRQEISGGFTATFGNVSISADDYVVVVDNNAAGGFQDTLSFRFDTTLVPSITRPLVVNGVPHQVGFFSISFLGDASQFSSSLLPLAPDLASFNAPFNALDDSVAGADVIFSISAVTPVEIYDGDFDFDQDVDGEDFLEWQRSFGSQISLAADGNDDRVVDAFDLLVWQNDYGLTIPMTNAHAVPEPRTICLIIFAVVSAFGSKRVCYR